MSGLAAAAFAKAKRALTLAQTVESDQVAQYDPTALGYDIWLSVGQSNEVGRGTAFNLTWLDPLDPRIYQFANDPAYGDPTGGFGNQIVIAKEPLAHGAAVGMGHTLQFARWYSQTIHPNRRVLIVPVARGSTAYTGTTERWAIEVPPVAPSDGLHENSIRQALRALAAAGPNSRIVGVVYALGETDGSLGNTGAAFQANLDAQIADLRTRLSEPALPFLICQMVPAFLSIGTRRDIDAVQIDTPRRVQHTAFVYGPTGSTYQEDPTGLTDTAHWGAPGQRVLGRRLMDGLLRAQANATGAAPLVPSGLTLTQAGAVVTAAWAQPVCRVTDFGVQYRLNGGAWTDLVRTQSIDVTAAITVTKGDAIDVRVRSFNEQGNSAWSSSASLTTVTDPAVVTGLGAVPGAPSSSVVELAWTAGARATSYLVEYKTTASGTWLTSGTVTTPSARVVGLVPITDYNFRVTSVNVAGSSAAVATTATTDHLAYVLDEMVAAGITLATDLFGAFSSRKMRAAYAGSAIRVVRLSDLTELDIGFLANGEIDAAAIATFGAGTTVSVKTWYDQSGQGRDHTNTTQANQPTIYTGGALVVLNGKAAPQFDGTNDVLTRSFTAGQDLWAVGTQSLLSVQAVTPVAAAPIWAEGRSSSATPYNKPLMSTTGGKTSSQPRNDAAVTPYNGNTGVGSVFADSTPHQVSVTDSGTVWSAWVDGGSTPGTFTYVRANPTTLDCSAIGARQAVTPTDFINGKVGELILLKPAITSGQRAAATANQKAYWGTP